LLESLSNYIHYNTTMKSHQEIHRIMSNSCHIHVLTPYSTCYLMTSKSHANAPPTNQFINHFISYCWVFRERITRRFNTNEYEPNPHKGLTSLLTQTLRRWFMALILIWCSTFSFLLNVELRLTLGFLASSPSSVSPFTLVFLSRANRVPLFLYRRSS